MLIRLFAFVALGAALQGCYKYVPVEAPTAVREGTEVRAELTDAGVATMAAQVGPSVYRIDGRLLTRSDSGLVLSVNAVTSRRTVGEQLWSGERVTLPQMAIGSLQTRELSRSRTALVAGGILAAVIGLYFAFDVAGTFGGGGEGGTGNTQ